MTATLRHKPSDFDQFDSPEHEAWKKHRQLLLQIPASQVWRGCLGLALFTTDPCSGVPALGRLFVPDRDVRWVSLVDLPRGCGRLRRSREVHWATVHRTKVRFGMPTLGGTPEAAYDFRAMPFDRMRRRRGFLVERGPDVLDPTKELRLFRTLNAVNWAMTSTAFFYRAAWQARRGHFFEAAGATFHPEARILLFGERRFDGVARPTTWMPRAYLGFKHTQRDKLFGWSTGPTGGRRHYPDGLKFRLCEDVGRSMPVRAPLSGSFVGATKSTFHGLPTFNLEFAHDRHDRQTVKVSRQARIRVLPSQVVREGDVVALDGPEGVPEGWEHLPLYRRWERVLPRLVRREHFDAWVRLWFERQLVTIQPDFVHIPSDLAALAARGRTVDGTLYWDLSPALDYYHEAADAFIFPTIRMRTWWDFAGVLPGEVRFDLTPVDARFLPHVSSPKKAPKRKKRLRVDMPSGTSPLALASCPA